MSDKWDDYTFSIRSAKQVLDYDIEEDLSIQNPMMIAEFEDQQAQRCEVCGGKGSSKEDDCVTVCESCEGRGRHLDKIKVYLHESIWNKARNSGEKNADGSWFDTMYEKKLYDLLGDCSEISRGTTLTKVIDLVKEIRGADWNQKRNTKITVRKIKL